VTEGDLHLRGLDANSDLSKRVCRGLYAIKLTMHSFTVVKTINSIMRSVGKCDSGLTFQNPCLYADLAAYPTMDTAAMVIGK